MLKRWRLPPDDFPDDTETRAFQNYRDGKVPSRFEFHFKWRPWRTAILFILLAVIAGLIGAFVLWWTEPGEQIVIITGVPTMLPDIPAEPLDGDFPADVPQQFIRIPARINDHLVAGERRGYTFFARAAFTWQITVEPQESSSFDPILSLYGPDGVVIDFNDNRTAEDRASQLTLVVEHDGAYALLLEGARGISDGAYALSILPAP
jgi:hypothetical protein